jgi:hypothetical protein
VRVVAHGQGLDRREQDVIRSGSCGSEVPRVANTRDDETSGYYLAPIAFFMIGLFQLFGPGSWSSSLVTIGGSVLLAVVAFRARRKSRELTK